MCFVFYLSFPICLGIATLGSQRLFKIIVPKLKKNGRLAESQFCQKLALRMSQEVSKKLGSVGYNRYNPNKPHLQVGH